MRLKILLFSDDTVYYPVTVILDIKLVMYFEILPENGSLSSNTTQYFKKKMENNLIILPVPKLLNFPLSLKVHPVYLDAAAGFSGTAASVSSPGFSETFSAFPFLGFFLLELSFQRVSKET